MPIEDFRDVRIEKSKKLRDMQLDPYPASVPERVSIASVLERFDAHEKEKSDVTVAGRIRAKRGHGGITFVDLDDGTGTIQALFVEDTLGKDYELFHDIGDIGDFVSVHGVVMKTARGERSVTVDNWRMLTKSIRPLPEKWHGLHDVEDRLRKRYLDLIMDPSERELFMKKSRFWQAIRSHLIAAGGLEVETPVLEQIPGGADAEPFTTHLNALDVDLYLRISLELPLKRLIVGGYEKVFEIGRIFRNEGIDREHLQDYTQMEMYWAYTDYQQLMQIVADLYRDAIQQTLGELTHTYQGQSIDWSGTWPTVDYYETFREHTGLDLAKASEKELKSYAQGEGIDTAKHVGRGRLIDIIFKKKVRPHFIQPAFLVLPPVDIEPLAKRWPQDPGRVERFQVMVAGSEMGKGFSELNDPLDQQARFEEQSKLREAGDVEAQRMDADFVEALEYGMPPTAGFGMSERLFSFIMDRPVRETVFFPLMKPTNE
jgi:lysyl-tRNA synthetase, class II